MVELIDPKVIENMIQSTSQEIAATLIASFPGELEKQKAALLDAQKDTDSNRFKAAAHTLKGVAASFGALELSDLAKQAETVAPVDMDRMILEIDLSIARTRAWFTEKGYHLD